MTLLQPYASPLDDIWISLDLETTGLSTDKDEIIEIGAVKFQGDVTIDTFHTLVNPHKTLSNFIKRYTGISQEEVDTAPPFSRMARELVQFIGSAPIIGHNIAFDLGFLASKGLKLSNPRCDTWDMAFVLLPQNREYALAKISASLGISHHRPHRALEDAQVTMALFLKLIKMATELDVYTLAEMERLASRSSWVLSYILKGLEGHKTTTLSSHQPLSEQDPQVGITGLDVHSIRERHRHARTLKPNQKLQKIEVDRVAALLGKSGPLTSAVPKFEERTEQMSMARAVANAINEEKHLMVEAGTGVGKSLAYLLPAALYALENNKRVVVSTNTINLQEQLLTKDIPALVKVLETEEPKRVGEFRYTQLKGRANYLCLTRWSHLRSSDNLTDDEARLLSKVMVWLKSSTDGDRSELNLANRNAAAPWDKMSAQGAQDCTGFNGACFLRAARDRAAAAHLVVVNHALLMADLVSSRALIPDYDVLIIDEAHHLEDEATKHLGFEMGQSGINDHLQSLVGDRGLLNRVTSAVRGSSAAETRSDTIMQIASSVSEKLPAVRESLAGMFHQLTDMVNNSENEGSASERETRVTVATRNQPGWSQLEIQWETVDLSLEHLHNDLASLNTSLEGLENANVSGYDGLLLETLNGLQRNTEARQQLMEFIPQPSPDRVYWVSRSERLGDLVLHSAPLHVGEHLGKLLYSQTETVVLTSATLSTKGTFDHIIERTGFGDADELLLGSPFDYPKSAMLYVPIDMPEPNNWAYQTAIEQAIIDAALTTGGRTMALFTSHAALQTTASAIRGSLQSQGIDVLAQRLDGSPHQLVRTFVENPKSILLGTASFWEGIDLAGDSLKVLLVARLPFTVPTEPVFKSRSELYEDSFNGFAVPQAILRIRQGFGRLIRTKTDRGAVVILDSRIVSRRYGKAFVDSLPPVTFKTGKLHEMSDQISDWINHA